MSARQELVKNYNFNYWTAGSPDNWQQTFLLNGTTLVQLKKNDPREHPERRVLPIKQYVYDGESSLRARILAAGIANDFVLRQSNAAAGGILVDPLHKYSVNVTARCNVPGNLLRVRIIGLVGTTDTMFLEPIGNTTAVAINYRHLHQKGFVWNTSARDMDVVMHDIWETFGFELLIPATMTSISVRVGNGSAGAQVIDLGAVSINEITDRLVGAA